LTQAPNQSPVSGLLHFDFGFKESGRLCRLKSATVDVTVKCRPPSGARDPDPTVEDQAPRRPITAAQRQQEVGKRKEINPQGSFEAAGAAASASGYDREINIEYNEIRRWTFNACIPSVAQGETRVRTARFEWNQGLEHDTLSLGREYCGALLVERETSEPLVLTVTVKAKAWNWFESVLCAVSGQQSPCRDSQPIRSTPTTTVATRKFAELKDTLQEDIISKNDQWGPVSMLSHTVAHL
jgi:hypothetical protein